MHNKAIKWLWRHYNIALDNVSVKDIISQNMISYTPWRICIPYIKVKPYMSSLW